tara:strand:- start:615 stop:977 length:363 start_codon:yes stop_codon:yes gene_type:complete
MNPFNFEHYKNIQAYGILREYKKLDRINRKQDITQSQKRELAAASLDKIKVSKDNLRLMQESRSLLNYFNKKRERDAIKQTRSLFAENTQEEELEKKANALLMELDQDSQPKKQKGKGRY